MAQWGTEKTINGFRFVPHVDTPGFAPSRDYSPIDAIILIDDRGQPDAALTTVREVQDRFIGQPYSEWTAK